MSGVCGVVDEDRKMLVFLAFSTIGESDDSDIDVEDILDISSSSSSSEDELVNTILVLNKKRGKLELRPRIQRHVEETIPRLSDHEFESHFRSICDRFNVGKATAIRSVQRPHQVTQRQQKDIKAAENHSNGQSVNPDEQ
ncbi:hypothetical protein PV328_007640 [Microctonus aethiopoides]|uniref:Uncharacterized protein n=1 Tax=Microctonus aethiopoides TaxID=144406 RepID=A0AA39C9K7_9HYME|nr:hypothetical protein PV328_007640 [Microctonus aethiopoides]